MARHFRPEWDATSASSSRYLERFAAEENAFLEFTEWLTRSNENKPAVEPASMQAPMPG